MDSFALKMMQLDFRYDFLLMIAIYMYALNSAPLLDIHVIHDIRLQNLSGLDLKSVTPKVKSNSRSNGSFGLAL